MPSNVHEYLQLTPFDLPESPEWSVDKMLVRKAVAVSGKRINAAMIASAVRKLDNWAVEFGLARHGRLVYESWSWERAHWIAATFRIVDVAQYQSKIQELARRDERLEIRNWPWWRRLLLPILKDGGARL